MPSCIRLEECLDATSVNPSLLLLDKPKDQSGGLPQQTPVLVAWLNVLWLLKTIEINKRASRQLQNQTVCGMKTLLQRRYYNRSYLALLFNRSCFLLGFLKITNSLLTNCNPMVEVEHTWNIGFTWVNRPSIVPHGIWTHAPSVCLGHMVDSATTNRTQGDT